MKNEGLNNCIKPIIVDDNIVMLNANSYFSLKEKPQYKLSKEKNIVAKLKEKVKKLIKQN